MICPNCQNEVAEGAAFCSSCGNKIEQVPAAPVTPQEPMPTAAEAVAPSPAVEAPLPPVEPITPISNTPAAPEMTAMPAKKTSSKKAIWITVAVVVCLLVLGAGGFGVYYYLQQSALKRADAQLQEAADKLGENTESESSESAATTAKAVKIASPNDAYKFAMTKITYKNPGVTVMKLIAKEDGSYGSYEVTVIDKNSVFKKDGYDYFKAKKVVVNQTGEFKVEDVDHLGGNSATVLTDFGNVDLSNNRLATVVAEGKKDLLAKGYKLGNYYAVFFTDDQSNLSGSKDKFEVYYTKAGQDETTKGYKKLTAYVVQLEQPNLTPLQYAESSLGFILE